MKNLIEKIRLVSENKKIKSPYLSVLFSSPNNIMAAVFLCKYKEKYIELKLLSEKDYKYIASSEWDEVLYEIQNNPNFGRHSDEYYIVNNSTEFIVKSEEITVTTTGQYQSSLTTFTGTKKQVLNYLRDLAVNFRRQSREAKKLPNSVHSIDVNLHPSKLVTMASFKIKTLGIQESISLLNNHGVLSFSIS